MAHIPNNAPIRGVYIQQIGIVYGYVGIMEEHGNYHLGLRA